eukprot:TRINITY_DN4360_c1_g2_i1.p1 TRINITY_DN4360_c1_g2~~TRINITY_DN4360_c1_g2_i1.p1  ORF type:complete len:283 (-),score=40.55 TRINITY_DN4360_c1_g2_i1:175-1023(-)
MGCGASKPGGRVWAKHEKYQGQVELYDKPIDTEQEEQIRLITKVKEAFTSIDVDSSGAIDKGELNELLRKIGKDDLSEDKRAELFSCMDLDGNGSIQYSEFAAWVLQSSGHGDSITVYCSSSGRSDLHEAIIAGADDKVVELIAQGAKVNVGDLTNVTPLHYASRCGQLKAAAALLDAKADVAPRTSDSDRTPLHAAAEQGHVDVCKLLIQHGANINESDGKIWTPLHWACASSREECALFLVESGADMNPKTLSGYTPFAMAEDWATTSLANMLREKGALR